MKYSLRVFIGYTPSTGEFRTIEVQARTYPAAVEKAVQQIRREHEKAKVKLISCSVVG